MSNEAAPREEIAVGNSPIHSQPQQPAEPPVPKPERTGKRGVFVPVAIAAIATFIFVLLLDNYLSSRKPDLPAPKPRPVKTLIASPANGEITLKYPGQTRAIKQVDVGCQVGGSLIDLPINAGDIVKKNQVLARLDPRDFQNALDARTADYLNAKTNLERQQKLYAAATVAKSKVDDAVAAFKIAEANKNIAEKARQDCTLKAPFDGVVAKRYVDNFQSVTQGQPLISLQDLSKLEIEVDFPEWLVAKARNIAQGTNARATYDSLPDKVIDLKIREFAAEADPQTRTYAVRFSMMNNPDLGHVDILPGMTATVSITITPYGAQPNIFLLPVWAVVSDNNKDEPYVYVVNDKVHPWTVSQRKVTVGEMTGDTVLVKTGIAEGERIVIAGAARLEEGFQVRDLPQFLKHNSSPAHSGSQVERLPSSGKAGEQKPVGTRQVNESVMPGGERQ